MQRDMDLVRQILLKIEADPNPMGPSGDFVITGVHRDIVGYHLKLLDEAGYIETINIATRDQPLDRLVNGLTWSGHEFLDAARDDGRWEKAKALLGGTFNTVTVKVLNDLLVSLIKGTLWLP